MIILTYSNFEKVFNEKARLKSLLEKNGYNNIDSHAITFMIDTTLGNNSFSIQVNINLAKDELSETKKEFGNGNDKISFQSNDEENLIQPANSVTQTHSSNVSTAIEVDNKEAPFHNTFSANN